MKRYLYILLSILLAGTALSGCSKDGASVDSNMGSGSGTGGSLARFIIVGNYLYVVDNNNLYTYDVSNYQSTQYITETQLGFNIETIFNLDDKLFIGSQSAMYIYDISRPSNPQYVSSVSHLRACDPVVANDRYAYVTIREGSNCGGEANSLIIYDISNLISPERLNTIELYNPHGLALYGTTLYVCDGTQGLKIFDLSDGNDSNPQFLKNLSQSVSNTYYDCIAKDGYLYTMLDNGFVIYDISNPHEPIELSKMLF